MDSSNKLIVRLQSNAGYAHTIFYWTSWIWSVRAGVWESKMFVSLWQTTWCILMMQALRNGFESILKVDSYFLGTCVFSIYSHVQKSREKCVFRPEMAIFRRAGMRKGGLPLPLAFQYLIFMIWRACDLNLVMIS